MVITFTLLSPYVTMNLKQKGQDKNEHDKDNYTLIWIQKLSVISRVLKE
jgi:hypothetical protein